MVGVPRSKGCRTCVQRRVRCDQGKPVCGNCQKGNRDCVYSEGLKFQDEGVRLRRKYETKASFQGESSTASTTSLNLNSSSTESTTTTTEVIDHSIEVDDSPIVGTPVDSVHSLGIIVHGNSLFQFLEQNKYVDVSQHDRDALGPSASLLFDGSPLQQIISENPLSLASVRAPFGMQEQLFNVMHSNMFPPNQTNNIPEMLRSHGSWFKMLPPLMGGHHQVLDCAVRAVTLAHLGRLHGSTRCLEESRPWYGKTLKLLNKALLTEETGMAEETLASTIMLSFYEMFASDSNASWVAHAGGAGALIKARGPDAYRFGMAREMFIAYRHTIIIEACQRDQPCFLAEPEWRDLSKSIFHDLRSTGRDVHFLELFDLAEMLYDCMLDIPELLYRSKHFRSIWKAEKAHFPTLRDFIADLIERCSNLRQSFRIFYFKFKGALSKCRLSWTATLSDDPAIPIYYRFPNIFVASSVTGYWTINILLNIVLIELSKDIEPEKIGLYRAENRDSALEICRSVKYMLTSSFLGPFFIIFGLRISLTVLQDREERDWVVAKLFEIGQTHMAMASHVPGFEAGVDMPRVRAALSGSGFHGNVLEFEVDPL